MARITSVCVSFSDVGYERFLAPEVFFNPEIVKCVLIRVPVHVRRLAAS